MTFGERLIQLRKENGYSTRNEFAEKLGIPSTTLRNYETDAREPGHSFLIRIAELFDVSVDYLLCLTNEKERTNTYTMKSFEYEHIEKYRSLDAYGQETVSIILDREVERVNTFEGLLQRSENLENNAPITSIEQPGRIIQYYQRLASAGSGQLVFDDIPTDLIEIPDIPKYRKVKFAIGVNGNSMTPTFYNRDVLLIEPAVDLEPGEIGIFMIDGESFVKELGKRSLLSHNTEYPPIPLTSETNCIGRVIDKLHNPADDLASTLSPAEVEILRNGAEKARARRKQREQGA